MAFLRQYHSTVHRETTAVQENTSLTRTTHPSAGTLSSNFIICSKIWANVTKSTSIFDNRLLIKLNKNDIWPIFSSLCCFSHFYFQSKSCCYHLEDSRTLVAQLSDVRFWARVQPGRTQPDVYWFWHWDLTLLAAPEINKYTCNRSSSTRTSQNISVFVDRVMCVVFSTVASTQWPNTNQRYHTDGPIQL